MIIHFDKKILILIFSILSLMLNINAQEIKISAHQQKLSNLLIELNKSYNIDLSFNQKLLENCIVSDSGSYDNPEAAISKIVSYCGFSYELNNGVFIIYKPTQEESDKTEESRFYFSGQLVDSFSSETLSYSKIIANSREYLCDANGNFSFFSKKENLTVIVSHAGYYIQSYELNASNFKKLEVTPSVIGLKEIVLSEDIFSEVSNNRIGDSPGLIKLNQKAAKFLPGNNSNVLYNFLRLQPGILASVEQSGDYSIWGSYKGQTLVKYDGITLFSSTSMNNEIGIINPLMVKDIEVFKGGYTVDKGDRVGGIINMLGTQGSKEKFSANINVNSKTVSAIISIPILEKYSIQAGFRQSYYNVIDWDELSSIYSEQNSYSPEYSFRDINLKFSGNLESGDNFYISALANSDQSEIAYENTGTQSGKLLASDRKIDQKGASFHYNKNWSEFGRTSLDFTFSNYNSGHREEYKEKQSGGGLNIYSVYNENYIDETSLKVEHKLPAIGIQHIDFGISYIVNSSNIFEGETEATQALYDSSTSRINIFVKDDIYLSEYLSLLPGIRLDYSLDQEQIYFQPRIQAIVKPNDRFRINLAWGYYNQYVSNIILVDDLNNRTNSWILSDDSAYPVVKGIHYVLGMSYKIVGLSLSVETYFKTINNMSKYRRTRNNSNYELYFGDARSYGVDFYVEKKVNRHNFWISYSLGRTEDRYANDKNITEYKRAYQDQTHELKGAAILDFHPWYISANYVYGSGIFGSLSNSELSEIDYNRMDAALLYKFNTQVVNVETGFSIENVFNSKNIANSNYTKLPGGQSIYSRAIPFTPSVFVNIGF